MLDLIPLEGIFHSSNRRAGEITTWVSAFPREGTLTGSCAASLGNFSPGREAECKVNREIVAQNRERDARAVRAPNGPARVSRRAFRRCAALVPPTGLGAR